MEHLFLDNYNCMYSIVILCEIMKEVMNDT